MATEAVNAYQLNLQKLLSAVFTPEAVRGEWAAMRGELGLYSPRIDVAVGPFAISQRHIRQYDRLAHEHRPLLERLFETHSSNLETIGENPSQFGLDHVIRRNRNARCFLAIEIENRVSNKHLMGGAINAAALGRVGLAVAWSENNLRQFLRMRSYLLFLSSVGKNSFDPSNLLILSATQLRNDLIAYTKVTNAQVCLPLP